MAGSPLRHGLLLALALVGGSLLAQDTAVTLDGRQLWVVKNPRAGFSPADRAKDIQDSLVHVASDTRQSLAEARDLHLETESVLLLSRSYVFSVTDDDARAEGRPRAALFAERKQIALEALARYREQRAIANRLRSAGLAFGSFLLALLAVALLRRLHTRVANRTHELLRTQFQRGHWAALYQVFEAPLALVLRAAVRIVFFAAGLTIVFSLFSFALGLFPATMGVSGAILTQAIALLSSAFASVVAYLPNLAVLLLVAAFTYALIWIARTLAVALESGAIAIGGFHAEWAMPSYDLVKILLILFALVVAFPYLPGGDSAALKGASIFVGVLVSLGSGSAMGNVVSGVILTYMRPFRVGDRVQVGDTVGDVVEKSLLVTRLRTIKNVEVILPNSAILGAQILNYSSHAAAGGLILHTTVTLGYDAPWQTVHQLLINAALRTDGILADPKPFVYQTSLNDSHISYELNATTRDPQRMAQLYSDLHRHIQDEFNAAGVEIMSPMYLSVRDGNTVTTPEPNRPAGYQPPAFQVRLQDPR